MPRTARILIEAQTERVSFIEGDTPTIAKEKDYCDWGDAWIVSNLERLVGGSAKLETQIRIAERYYPSTNLNPNVFCSYEVGSIFDSLDWKDFAIVLERQLDFLGYPDIEVASEMSAVSVSTEQEFNSLATQWRRETGMMSMIHKKAMHPAYQRIIGMGKVALPFIFRELKERGGHWLWALCSITGEDAAKPEHNLKQAVEAWLEWGKKHGYL